LEELFPAEVRDAYLTWTKLTLRAMRGSIVKTADFLKNYPTIKVNIEGHCDERGSTDTPGAGRPACGGG